MVFKKIFVAIDRSVHSSLVCEQALEIAQLQHSQLMLFHALRWTTQEPTGPFMGIGTLADIDLYNSSKRVRQELLQEEMEKVKSWLSAYCQQATAKGIRAEFDCHVGDAGSWICDLASNWGADLIVLGRRGHKGLSEIVLGSVSNYVMHHAPCSVLVVQGEASPTIEPPVAGNQVNTSGRK